MGARQLDAGIRHDLNDLLEIAFAGNRCPCIVEYPEMTFRFLLRGDIQHGPNEAGSLAVGKIARPVAAIQRSTPSSIPTVRYSML